MKLLQGIESKIITAISGALAAIPDAPKIQIFGLWQPTLADLVRNKEDPDTVATIAIGLGTPSVQTYSASSASITGSILITVRIERDTAGTAFAAISDAIGSLLTGWNADNYQAAFDALDTEDFNVGDVTTSPGAAPAVDFERKLVSVAFPFTISGNLT